jgi:hypothetical protein
VSQSLDRPDNRPLVARGKRSYELASTKEAALDLLRAPSSPPILSLAEARRAPVGTKPFIVLSAAGFTIYKPWRFKIQTVEGATGEDLAVGPAITGRLVPTPRGTRVDVRVTKYAPAPAQRRKLGAIAVASTALLIAMVTAVGAHPVLLSLWAVMIVGVMGSILFYRHRRRSQDIRDLLAIVERTFGPLELPSGDDAPHRREER